MEFSFLNIRFYLLIAAGLLASCTRELDIELPSSATQLVVEGRIETGSPPVVLLSRSSSFYDDFILDSAANYFVSGAHIVVSDGTDSVILAEVFIDTAGVSIPVYVGFGFLGQEGKTYQLRIKVEGKVLRAVTSIPKALPLDSLWWETMPESDTLVRLLCRFTDPPEPENYVRYFTKRNAEPFMPGFNSVFEDDLVNGQSFDFPLDRGVDRNNPETFEHYGLFYRGDTITVKWCAIDAAHFEFWRTLEFELGGQGSPFAAPVIIKSNIEGGLGIWGGYAPSYHQLIVPR
ncbi:MAG: DUF4249 domain-containing protein [Chitinophagales bacterium]|nr:DUF4249 domain-containing protein [Chitinophagales bacterium]MDW8427582.1 DUF4249 domain-containing protein [Chitinophagales bacterium]